MHLALCTTISERNVANIYAYDVEKHGMYGRPKMDRSVLGKTICTGDLNPTAINHYCN